MRELGEGVSNVSRLRSNAEEIRITEHLGPGAAEVIL